MRLKLTLAYDGRPFQGWQKQPNASTVQNLLENALSSVAKEPLTVQGSGRTDAGVHANGQVVHFDTPHHLQMNPYNWVPALNTKLPAAIRVMECEEVAQNFHSRFDAKEKIYVYTLSRSPILHPLKEGLVWHLPRQLNLEDLELALNSYLGTHDFRNLSALRGNESEQTDYTRTIEEASFASHNESVTLTFRSSGFLYKMVRILTGAAVEVAQGKLLLEDQQALLNPDIKPTRPPFCAPAGGLTLERVIY